MSGRSQVQTTAVQTQTVTTNPALCGIVQRKCACGGNAGFTAECEECRKKNLIGETRPLIQTKLKISQPGDKYEQEADRAAEQVMRMPEPTVQRQVEPEEEEEELLQAKPLANQITPLVQRQVDEEEEEEEVLQAKSTSGHTQQVTPAVADSINALRGGGQPLDPATRAFMEPRFGHDFSQVRVHADASAADIAQEVRAKAFTVGSNLVFGAGHYAPKTTQGRRLLAHELTHVVQQEEAPWGLVRRKPESGKCTGTLEVACPEYLNEDNHKPGFSKGTCVEELDAPSTPQKEKPSKTLDTYWYRTKLSSGCAVVQTDDKKILWGWNTKDPACGITHTKEFTDKDGNQVKRRDGRDHSPAKSWNRI